MATGTFTHFSLCTKKSYKAVRKIHKSSKNWELSTNHAVGMGTNSLKKMALWFSTGSVRFTRYCGKMSSRHFFFLNVVSNQLFGHFLYSWPTQKASSVLLLFLFLLLLI